MRTCSRSVAAIVMAWVPSTAQQHGTAMKWHSSSLSGATSAVYSTGWAACKHHLRAGWQHAFS